MNINVKVAGQTRQLLNLDGNSIAMLREGKFAVVQGTVIYWLRAAFLGDKLFAAFVNHKESEDAYKARAMVARRSKVAAKRQNAIKLSNAWAA